MRLWILSDLHIEQSDWDLPQPLPDFDVLIAAGDIHDPASEGIRWLAERVDKPVVYVPGNHEWYSIEDRFELPDEAERARELASSAGIHFLIDEAVVIDGVRFLGATLWTNYDLYGTRAQSMKVAAMKMNDHRYIFPDSASEALQPEQALEWHQNSARWLTEQLRPESFLGPTVVVTHHMPHVRSIAPQYDGDSLNPAFCSDLAWLIEPSNATLWVHGHTHSSCDYRAGGTRIVCNPKGYGPTRSGGRYENSAFDPLKMVVID
ncbi:metallophosphoesterase [Sphingomonas sp. PR090111-T3T-6A]|uniref:metallophosphoesterase n=1 Tax=Sphingomonas sp. PR090111-T3T-6A TaxID=685778 RepID=UPI0003603550|nr:metallophosphoesterase [Sphingomonas sp. PR090111-T3T-6A]